MDSNWSDDFHIKANYISKLIDTCPDLLVKAKLYKQLGYILNKHWASPKVVDGFASVAFRRIEKTKKKMGIVGDLVPCCIESEEMARLTAESLARGNEIEYVPYVRPSKARVLAEGFMRKFERENEHGI